jgi:hypothetical protein
MRFFLIEIINNKASRWGELNSLSNHYLSRTALIKNPARPYYLISVFAFNHKIIRQRL